MIGKNFFALAQGHVEDGGTGSPKEAGPSTAPREEIGPSGRVSTRKYLDKNWDEATFGTKGKSIDFHVGKHGKGLSPVQYTQQALKAFKNSAAKKSQNIRLAGTASTKSRLSGRQRIVHTDWQNHLVSPKLMNRLRKLFIEVKRNSVDFDRHSETLHDVVFDLNTAESAVIGIADQLLSNKTPAAEQLTVLDKTFMHGDEWLLFDGGKQDLSADEELLRHARNLQSLQQECRRYLNTQ
jgi:hypothetical protein